MKKPLILIVVLSILYCFFLLKLLQNEAAPYAYDKPFFESIYFKTINDELQEQVQKIKATPGWLAAIKKQAKERGISDAEMLKINAKYIINQNKKKRK